MLEATHRRPTGAQRDERVYGTVVKERVHLVGSERVGEKVADLGQGIFDVHGVYSQHSSQGL